MKNKQNVFETNKTLKKNCSEVNCRAEPLKKTLQKRIRQKAELPVECEREHKAR